MKKLILLFVLFLHIIAAPVWAADTFSIKRIKIEGLQRISYQTVHSYLHIKEGEELSSDQTSKIIKSLYKTGFFDDVSLEKQDNQLIIHVIERPTIGQLKISGNSVIPTDKLTSVMKSLDISEGRVYNRAILDRIKQSLLNQYYELGRYNARVNVSVASQPRNRVVVNIDISEGLVAKIRHITIIGNHVFRERLLDKQLTVTTPGLYTFITQTDRYSEEKLNESLESLRNFYLDRGYIKFAVKSSQVSITPDRKSVYVTIVIDEGLPYTVKGYTLTGDFVVPRADLMRLVAIKQGSTFSRRVIADTEKAINDTLGDQGYIYASITLNPTVDEQTRQVFLDFQIKAGKRTYVRHVYFSDNAKTNDVVLRREVQQMEAGAVSTSQLEESKRRLNLLPYIKDVQMAVKPVPGTDDQVDINYKVTEDNAAQLTGSIGYSQLDHLILGAGVSQKNFLGTGKSLNVNFQTSRAGQNYSVSYTDPYFTVDGISRSTSASISKTNPGNPGLNAGYRMDEYDISDVYGIPIGLEKNVINRFVIGYGYQGTLLKLDSGLPAAEIADFIAKHGRHFQQLNLLAGLTRDSRDKAIFPTRGALQSLGLNLYLPLDHKLTYYTLNYSGRIYQPLAGDFIFTAKSNIAYGNNFNRGRNYPFYKNFYTGGIESIRGYTDNTLGPRDENAKPMGGNFLVNGSVGLILPSYFSDNVRTTLFLDGGNVYNTYNNRVFGGLASGHIRFSAGIGVEWLTGFLAGPIDFSLARAINPIHHDNFTLFQFALGANFG